MREGRENKWQVLGFTFRFGEQVRHYRLFYARNCYYVGEFFFFVFFVMLCANIDLF